MNKQIQFVKNNKWVFFFVFTISFSLSMFVAGQAVKEKEFYEERQFFRETWDCKTIEANLFPTGTWNSLNGNSQREYLNSLWIVKECWRQ